MKLNKIYIVTDAPIPIGMAPTNRILSYANGFLANGIACEIIIFRKTENTVKITNHKSAGTINGFNFQYLFKSPIKSKYFLKRRIDNLYGALRLLFFVIFYIKSSSAIIYYSSYNYTIFILKIAKLFHSFILIKEESEHPEVYLRSQNLLSKFFSTKVHYHLFDGYLLMTQNLIKYFNSQYPKIPSVHIKMTVDLERFSLKRMKDSKSLTYIGYLNNKKDGVDILIDAFSKITHKYPEYILTLYGEVVSNTINLEYYINKAETLGIPKNKIIFYGKVDNSYIPQILANSKLVLLARPNNIQAENAFPTKLGEYLASSTPVVVTAVGEIPNYLKDGKSAFIAKPGDSENFANKIEEALSDYENALQVGINGRRVAETHFNNKIQTVKIIKFIQEF